MASYPEYYRELIDNAHDAVQELLKAGAIDSWIHLRSGYSEIRRAQEYDNRLIGRERERTEQKAQEHPRQRSERETREAHARRAAWQRAPMERRESLLLHVLGDERLTRRELADRVNAEITPEGAMFKTIYDVSNIADRLLKAGQLEREGELFRGKIRYRYFRKRELEGPIADLERAYHDDEETR